jgi:AbrB family looped-hinge helix DNA binding protein
MVARGRSHVTSKGTVTIPVEIRRELGLEPGDSVVFVVDGDHAVLSRARSVVEATRGVFAAYVTGPPPDDSELDRLIEEAVAAEYAEELQEARRLIAEECGRGTLE